MYVIVYCVQEVCCCLLCLRGMLLSIVFKRYVYCYMLTQSLACFCNSSMVPNLCFNSSVSVFYDFHTHFCSLQQPMRESVGNKNKKRVFRHTCCAHVIASSVLYLQWVLLKQCEGWNELTHCMVIQCNTILRLTINFTFGTDTWTNVNGRAFKLQSAIERMQVGAKLSSFAVKHFSKFLVVLYSL